MLSYIYVILLLEKYENILTKSLVILTTDLCQIVHGSVEPVPQKTVGDSLKKR